MIGVGDEQPIALLVGEQLARIQQRLIVVALAFELQRQRRSIDLAALVEYAHHRADRVDEAFEIALAHRGADEVAGGIDDDARRPRLRAVAPPDLQVGVVGDRMLDLVANEDPLQVVGALLVRELRRVHADDDELVGEALLERLEIAQHVHAVDAAVGPEVENHDLAAQLLDRHAAPRR